MLFHAHPTNTSRAKHQKRTGDRERERKTITTNKKKRQDPRRVGVVASRGGLPSTSNKFLLSKTSKQNAAHHPSTKTEKPSTEGHNLLRKNPPPPISRSCSLSRPSSRFCRPLSHHPHPFCTGPFPGPSLSACPIHPPHMSGRAERHLLPREHRRRPSLPRTAWEHIVRRERKSLERPPFVATTLTPTPCPRLHPTLMHPAGAPQHRGARGGGGKQRNG